MPASRSTSGYRLGKRTGTRRSSAAGKRARREAGASGKPESPKIASQTEPPEYSQT